MAIFYNRAALSYRGTQINSNEVEGEILPALSLTKQALTSCYTPGSSISYLITITNNGDTSYEAITLTDDLGADGETVPQSYVENSLIYLREGVISVGATVTDSLPLTISGINVPASGTVNLIYEVTATADADYSDGATISNTVQIDSPCGLLTATAEIGVCSRANLTIAKSISPDTLNCGDRVTYTFVVQNSGNRPVVATDNARIEDTFTPPLTDITVRLDGVILTEGVGYLYNEETGEFTTTDGTLPIPAATFSVDEETGEIIVTPGVRILTVTGTISG